MAMKPGGDAPAIAPDEGGLRQAWRAACVAWRGGYARGLRMHTCYQLADAAILAVRPDLDAGQAARQSSLAIAYAAANHGDWLYARPYGSKA